MACAALQCALKRHSRIVPPADKPPIVLPEPSRLQWVVRAVALS
jgi:hypothetical protein